MTCLKPSLFYLLYNRRLVSPERLKWALWYQFGRPWNATLSYSQVLIAFNDLTLLQLKQIREFWGPDLDEEPIGHLLLDHERIGPAELLKVSQLHASEPRSYLGGLLIQQGYTYREELEYILKKPLFKRPHAPPEQRAARIKAMELFRSRLWLRGYLSLKEIAQLELDCVESLPLSFKPLADLLVLNGDLPDFLVELMCVAPVPRGNDPLLPMLTCHGYPPDVLLPRLARELVAADLDKNLALLLAEKQMISRQRLTNLILETYRDHIKEAQGA